MVLGALAGRRAMPALAQDGWIGLLNIPVLQRLLGSSWTLQLTDSMLTGRQDNDKSSLKPVLARTSTDIARSAMALRAWTLALVIGKLPYSIHPTVQGDLLFQT